MGLEAWWDPTDSNYQKGSYGSYVDQYDHHYDTANVDGLAGVAEGWSWTWDRTIKLLIFSPIVLFTIFGNLVVLFAFITRKRELRAPTHFFIANLSLADLLVGILVLPFLATLHVTDRWYFGQNFCYAWIIIHFWLCSASILSTCAVCIERYCGVKYPIKHLNIMNPRTVYGMVIFVWIWAGFLTVTSVLAFPEESSDAPYTCRINMQIGHVLIATVGILYIPALIMIILYWRIWAIASKHLGNLKSGSVQRKGHSNQKPSTGTESSGDGHMEAKSATDEKLSLSQRFAILIKPKRGLRFNSKDVEKPSEETSFSLTGDGSSSGNNPAKSQDNSPSEFQTSGPGPRKQINLARRLALLVTVLLASYVPFFTAFLIRAFSAESVPDWLFITLGWIRYGNSCINPLIYAYAVPAYRKAFSNILKGKFTT